MTISPHITPKSQIFASTQREKNAKWERVSDFYRFFDRKKIDFESHLFKTFFYQFSNKDKIICITLSRNGNNYV